MPAYDSNEPNWVNFMNSVSKLTHKQKVDLAVDEPEFTEMAKMCVQLKSNFPQVYPKKPRRKLNAREKIEKERKALITLAKRSGKLFENDVDVGIMIELLESSPDDVIEELHSTVFRR
jgi:hypothetical protein